MVLQGKDGFTNILFAVATFFFFLGFVVFEGLKIEIGNTNSMVNPYVVLGFVFAFGATLWRFKKGIANFLRTI